VADGISYGCPSLPSQVIPARPRGSSVDVLQGLLVTRLGSFPAHMIARLLRELHSTNRTPQSFHDLVDARLTQAIQRDCKINGASLCQVDLGCGW
jgi:hypothetical protein